MEKPFCPSILPEISKQQKTFRHIGTASASDDHQLLKEIAASKQKAESPEGCFGIGTGLL